MNQTNNWKTKTILLGAGIGALTGLVASYILVQRAEKTETRPEITTGDGVKIGLSLLGVLRMISDFGVSKQ